MEVQTEDEQQFLARQQQILMQGQGQTKSESPMRTPPQTVRAISRTSVSKLLKVFFKNQIACFWLSVVLFLDGCKSNARWPRWPRWRRSVG